MFRRRRFSEPGEAVRGFAATLAEVERAKEELVAAVPSPRGRTRRPLADSLLAYEERLGRAADSMGEWRGSEHAAVWEQCRRALDEARARVDRLRLEAPDLDYESLVDVLAGLMSPLDTFDAADSMLRT